MGGYGTLKPQLLANVAQELCNQPSDFMVLTETWGELTPSDIADYQVHSSLQSTRAHKGGGIAILH